MKIHSRPKLDPAEEAQVAIVKLLKAAHYSSRHTYGDGVVSMTFRVTHAEMQLDVLFESGCTHTGVEDLNSLDFILKSTQ